MIRILWTDRHLRLTILLIGVMGVSTVIMAQPAGGDFVISKSTIDNGGGVSSGGDFSLTGTIGQHDASPQISTGGGFQLAGGFWGTVVTVTEAMFKDGFETD